MVKKLEQMIENETDVIMLSPQGVVSVLVSKRWTKEQIGKKMGVTELQAHYYGSGKTKVPNPEVCANTLLNIKIEGKPVLIDVYNSVEDLLEHYKMHLEKKGARK